RPDLFMKKELGEKEKRALIQLVKELMKDAG
ncbi:MAG: tRNA (guanosine(37)-N1)-methyltransferase TrmD, partial [Thermotoga sp.]